MLCELAARPNLVLSTQERSQCERNHGVEFLKEAFLSIPLRGFLNDLYLPYRALPSKRAITRDSA